MKQIAKIFVFFLLLIPSLVSGVEYSTGDFVGKWQLRYSDGFGYEFRFKENYRAYVILHLQGQVIVFRGIYAIDNGDTIRINISEMKEQRSAAGVESENGYVKTSASVFLFHVDEKSSDSMVLQKQKIKIDGRNSEGYFEDSIALKKK